MSRVLIVLVVIMNLAGSALAVPFLQLDATPRAGYSADSDTIIANGNQFSVRALINPADASFKANLTYYLSAAIVPQNRDGNFGSFTVNGLVADSNSGNGGYPMQYGTPPVNPSYPDLPAHGIFPTWYAEFSFTLPSNPNSVSAYNTEDLATASGLLYYQDFAIDISGLNDNMELHFDLYTFAISGKSQSKQSIKILKAPFSHDVESTSKVPDGGTTVALLGAALIGLSVFRRKIA